MVVFVLFPTFVANFKNNISMDLQPIIDMFERWFNGEHISEDETVLIILYIIICILIFATIILLILAAHVGRFWMHVGWFFEDIWEWMKYVYRKMLNIEEEYSEEE